MPSGASKRAPHARQLQPADRSPPHAGQASSPRTSMRSEDRVDEGGERFHGRRENEDQAEDAEEDGQRHEPPPPGLVAPQPAGEIDDRSARARDHDQATVEAAAVLDDHVPDSFSDTPAGAACLVIIVDPPTSTSTPQRRNAM